MWGVELTKQTYKVNCPSTNKRGKGKYHTFHEEAYIAHCPSNSSIVDHLFHVFASLTLLLYSSYRPMPSFFKQDSTSSWLLWRCDFSIRVFLINSISNWWFYYLLDTSFVLAFSTKESNQLLQLTPSGSLGFSFITISCWLSSSFLTM